MAGGKFPVGEDPGHGAFHHPPVSAESFFGLDADPRDAGLDAAAAELVFAVCEAKHVEVVIINQGDDRSFEEELASDVLEIVTVFSARMYGARSHKNKKLIEGVTQAVSDAAGA